MQQTLSEPDQKNEDNKGSNEFQNRETWSSGVEFLLSCISVSVGLGNIWRFPFTAYENGGGAFLIPYVIVLFLIGKPMYYMEVLLGQFTSKSSVKIWSLCPAFVGVGMGQAYAGVAVLTYYSSLLALTLYYFVASFYSKMPWSYCREEWGPTCVDLEQSIDITANTTKLQSSSELYFLKIVVRELDDISNGIGMPSLPLTAGLFVAWLITFLVIVRGVKTTGKAVYFLAIFPYILLIVLLIRAVTLEGALDGIIYFLKPNWKELLNLKVWKAAIVQCFFSLAVGLGPLVMFSSFNKFHHNVHRDAIIVTSLDTLTSFIAGITIFGILGNLAFKLKTTEIDSVVRGGAGLAFISYPDAISKFDVVPQLFGVMFFFMLFVLGIGTLVAQANTLVTILCDHYKGLNSSYVALGTTVFGFLSGLVYVTPAGQWILSLVDYYGSTFVIFGLALFQVIGVSWIYGLQNFCADVEFMTRKRVSNYWRLCWMFITPLFLCSIFVYSIAELKTLTYAGMSYPESANAAGWTLLAFGILQIPFWMIMVIAKNWKSHPKGVQAIKKAFSPSADWGPRDEKNKKEWLLYKESLAEKRKTELASSKRSVFCLKFKKIFK